MAKKLIRIQAPTQRDFEKYSNIDVDIVLVTGSVYFGQIKVVKLNEIVFSDKLNNKRIFSSQEVKELIVDEIHSF